KLNLPQTCARCHNDPKLAEQYRMKLPEAAAQYLDSIHGQGLLKMGLIVAPSCNDCHGVHDIIPGTYTNSPVFKANISRTCGKCHVKIEDVYNASVHGQLLMKGDPRGPVCTDCHGVHNISKVDDPDTGIALKDNLLEKCQRCHPDATSNFPDAWMSHYEPSPENFPLVYYVNLFYKFFIPAVLGGMILFIITDIYRRIINRVKGVKHS
ncbi:MAG TPA: cytochrome c3 family protein, partial [Anaerolineales bacterium]|nr:cytochrome c3 family protein [Anaerolineales bacterium]